MALLRWEDKNKFVGTVNRLQNSALMLSDNCFVKMSVNPRSPWTLFSTDFLHPLLLLTLLIFLLLPLILDFYLAFGTQSHVASKMF